MALTLISFIFLVAGLIRIKTIAKKSTKHVIYLLESCENILRSGSSNIKLTFKPSAAEINELQLTFNKVAKTINIANTQVKEGEEGKAMLNFNEAYQIFKDFGNERQMSVCNSNIGSLGMRIKEYKMAAFSYGKAAESIE